MTPRQLILEIQALAAKITDQVDTTRWYLFGSAVENPPAAADVDVLVICKTHAAADAIRRIIDEGEFYRPLHLSILTEAEEAEVCLVPRQGQVRVF